MKKGVIFSVKRCYRAICNHLLLVCFLFFLVYLYRSFPLVFFMLVSAAPVLVCTLVLLGALLSFGKPDMNKVELDECKAQEVVILKTAFSDNGHVEGNESEFVECSDKGTDVEDLTERTSEIVSDSSNAGSEGSSAKKVEKIFRDEEFDDRRQGEGKKRFKGFYLRNKRKILEERISHNQYSLITANDTDDEGDLGQENNELLVSSVNSIEENVDDFDSLPGSPWKHVDKEEGYDDDEAPGSGFIRAESSSPDESMAEISPILDELHPLLEEDASQPANLSRDDSDISSELTVSSSRGSTELDDEMDDLEELIVGEDDNEDGGDKEEIKEENEGQTKSAITWTAEDQKNLIDVGTSELERNKRLENLIAKRRARRCMTSVTERNLMDLDITDPPMNVSPIMKTRSNPFDPPLESYKVTSLPPIPDSAPASNLPWKNPFDIPFDLSDEKSDVMDGTFQQEFMLQHSKGPIIRRHESFNVHPSSFGMNSTEKQEMVFMPQQSKDPIIRRHESFNVHPSSFGMNRTEKQEMEFTPQQSEDLTFRRHESFNASFGLNGTEKQVMNRFRPYFVSEQLGSEGTSYSPLNRQPSEASGSKASSVPDTESFSSTEEEILIIDAEDDNAREPEVISQIDDASELVGHGSESSSSSSSSSLSSSSSSSSEEESLELGQEEKMHIKVDELDMKLEEVDNHQRTESSIKAESRIANQVEIGSSEIHQNNEAPDTSHKEPVYDSSPSEAFDPQVDSKVDLSAIVVKKSVSFSSRVTQMGSQGVNIDAIVDKVMIANSSEKTSVDERKMTSTGVDYVTKHEITGGKGESESMARRDLKMFNNNDIECDSAGDKLSRRSVISNIPENVPDNSSVTEKSSTAFSEKENLMNGHGASHKGHKGVFESPVPAEEVDTFKDIGSDSDESDMKKTIQNTPDYAYTDADSDNDESDMMETMQNAPEDTYRNVGSDSDKTDMKETMPNTPEGTFSNAGSDTDETDMKETMLNTPEVAFTDVSSDSDETDVKETMQNTAEDTASEVQTAESSDVGSPVY